MKPYKPDADPMRSGSTLTAFASAAGLVMPQPHVKNSITPMVLKTVSLPASTMASSTMPLARLNVLPMRSRWPADTERERRLVRALPTAIPSTIRPA